MHEQLIPLYILAGIFALYTIYRIIDDYRASRAFAAELLEPEDTLKDIKPTPTPFMELMKRNAE